MQQIYNYTRWASLLFFLSLFKETKQVLFLPIIFYFIHLYKCTWQGTEEHKLLIVSPVNATGSEATIIPQLIQAQPDKVASNVEVQNSVIKEP